MLCGEMCFCYCEELHTKREQKKDTKYGYTEKKKEVKEEEEGFLAV